MTTRSFYRRPFCNTNQESNHVRFKLLVCMSYLSKMLLDRDSDRDEEKVATPRQSRYQPYIYDFNSIITGCVQSPDSDQEQPDQEPGLELANGRAFGKLKNHRVLLSTISSSESMQCATASFKQSHRPASTI
ncbi:hypothetical protein SELMODRAFT_426709 [Selaginella moellendorffii]|uniref:Uncharacterized protein n=1 Tax=Selaginella moellendorffii TaxID=88036 RepID=D8SX88_SELML|nr:hypothetical protein SELMODRAFT_426709 [Selaginella moellendorffii]